MSKKKIPPTLLESKSYTVERRGCQYCIYYTPTGAKVLTVPGYGEKALKEANGMAERLNKQVERN